MIARRFDSTACVALRFVSVLALAAGSIAFAFAPSVRAHDVTAQFSPNVGDPAARIQVVIKKVKIYDDRDALGTGELQFRGYLGLCPSPHPDPDPINGDCPRRADLKFAGMATAFSAGDDEEVPFGRTFPRVGDQMLVSGLAEVGVPVHQGQGFRVGFSMWDVDPFNVPEDMGSADKIFDDGDNWGIGRTFTERSYIQSVQRLGDFDVTYEIVSVPLPELVANSLRFEGGGRNVFCMGVINQGEREAGPFDITFRADGLVPPGGKIPFNDLAAGDRFEHCYFPNLSPGLHEVSFVIDEDHRLTELNTQNNHYDSKYTIPAGVLGQQTAAAPAAPDTAAGSGAAEPKPSPVSGTGPAELSVSAICVNGKDASDRTACDPSKNDVSVAIKNAGSDTGGSMTARLVVAGQGGTAKERSAAVPGAGKTADVVFANVNLAKGDHKLVASVEGKGTREVPITCKPQG